MADISRGGAGEVGWFPTHACHAARWERSSNAACISIMLLLGGAGLFLCSVFNLWALEVAIGIDLPTAMYDVLAEIVMVNIVSYELLRNLVSNRRKVAETVCRGLGWVLWPAWAAGKLAARAVLRTAARVVGIAVNVLETIGSLLRKAVRRTVRAVLRAPGKVVAYAVGFLKAIISCVSKGATSIIYAVLRTPRRVVVSTIDFVKTKILRRWHGTRRTNDDDHDARRPRTIGESAGATEAADILPPRRRRHIGVVPQEVQRPSERMALRSDGSRAYTAQPPAKSHPRFRLQTQGEGEGSVYANSNDTHHRAPAPAPERLSRTPEKCDAPAPERVRVEKSHPSRQKPI